VDRICRQVKRWQGSDHRSRWVASALLFAESNWNRIHNYKHLAMFVSALHSAFQHRVKDQQKVLARHLGAA
jgi:hypothetical protein